MNNQADFNSQQLVPFWLIIPAAGIGVRMGSAVPKQYLTIADRTILEYTVGQFVDYPSLKKIVISLHPNDDYWQRLHFANSEKILTTIGGATRAESVLQGLLSLKSYAEENDWILVHDAVRPCIRKQMISNLLNEVKNHPVGGILGIPVTDTLKEVDDKAQIQLTVSRQAIWHAQTPQMFRYGLLREALENVLQQQNPIFDEAMAIEYFGKHPLMVMGDPHNIKISYPSDLETAAYYLSGKQE